MTRHDPGHLARVLDDVEAERGRQDAKFGEQNPPDGTGHAHRAIADFARDACDNAFRAGVGTWRHILAEEVAEAYAETDPDKLRTELIQVAAVAVAWVQAIDRRVDHDAAERYARDLDDETDAAVRAALQRSVA